MITEQKPNSQIINAQFILEPPNPNRVEIDDEELKTLAQSIKDIGLAQPITVRPIGDKYEIVAGHRRFKACLLANVINIPCIVRILNDSEAEQVKAHENLYRQDLNPLEEAIYISRLINKDPLKIPEVAKTLGRTEAWVNERLDLLSYPEYFWPAIEHGNIALGVAKWLAQITDDVYRKMFFESAVNNGMKVWQAETCYRQFEQGILTPSSIIMPEPTAENPRPTAIFQQECAKCGSLGESANLRTVWIHKECPPNSAAATS